jgi:chromosome segregation protein
LHLAKLEINGFKSFPHRTELLFEEGLMGVVGPNGCGKTNILDSIRWVLGEQRASLLRSSKSDEVIFNGTADLPPTDMAEVSLKIKNSRGVLPIDYDEIVITRRLYRSGDSEYLINNKQCRLKDITELFADTGMGTHAYSVFQTGMIDIILSDNAEERRYLFEEASGITKYKARKKEAVKKLENTEADMLRLQDLLAEISKNVRSLRRQAARARRYKSIREELRELEAVYAAAKAYDLELNARDREGSLLGLKSQREGLTAIIDKGEAEVQNLKIQINQLDEKIADETEKTAALDNQIIRIENKIDNIQRSLKNGRDNVNSWDTEIEALRQRVKLFAEQKQQASEQYLQNQTELTQLDAAVIQAESETLSRKAKIDESRQRLDRIREELHRAENELVAWRTKLESARNALDNLANRGQQLDSSLTTYQNRKEESSRNLAVQKERLRQNQEQIAELERWISSNQQSQVSLAAQLDNIKRTISSYTANRSALEARYDLLAQMIAHHEGYGSGVKTILGWNQKPVGVIDTLANLISSAEKYHLAVEAALNKYGQLIVCNSYDDAAACIDYLKRNSSGRASFLILDRAARAPIRSMDYGVDGILCVVADTITCPEYLKPIIDRLFGDIAVFESGKIPADYFGEAVDLEGNYRSRAGLMEGGNFGVSLVGRKDELALLLNKKAEIDNRLADFSSELNQKEAELIALSNQAAELAEKKRKMHSEREKMVAELSHIEFEFHDSQSKLDQLSIDNEESQKRREELNSLIAELDTKISAAIVELENRRGAFDIASKDHEIIVEEHEAKAAELNRLRLRFVEITGLAHKLQEDTRRFADLMSEAEQMINNKTAMIDSEKSKWSDYETELESLKAELGELFGAKETIDTEKKSLFVQRSELSAALNEREQDIKKARSSLNEINEKIHQIELGLTETKGQIKNLLDNVFNETSIHIAPARPENYDETKTIEDIQRLKRVIDKIGPVNMLADEEYQAEKDRLEFLDAQMKDLVEAKNSLKDAIAKINATAEEKFMTTLNSVKANFQEVFQTLFEGGIAEIKLTDPSNVLESPIEIIAHPGKKKNVSLSQLSGGERALVAISLLFSIYMVKPSPFCILDEIDAPLDDANVTRFLKLLGKFAESTQFIVITHNKKTMEAADILYGVTMNKPGVSSIVSVKFNGNEKAAAGVK